MLNDTFAFGLIQTRFHIKSPYPSHLSVERKTGIANVETKFGDLKHRLICDGRTGTLPDIFSLKDRWRAKVRQPSNRRLLVLTITECHRTNNRGHQGFSGSLAGAEYPEDEPLHSQSLSWNTFDEQLPAELLHSQDLSELLEQLATKNGKEAEGATVSFRKAVVSRYRDAIRVHSDAPDDNTRNLDFKKSADFSDHALSSMVNITFWGSETRSCLQLSHPNLYDGLKEETKVLLSAATS